MHNYFSLSLSLFLAMGGDFNIVNPTEKRYGPIVWGAVTASRLETNAETGLIRRPIQPS